MKPPEVLARDRLLGTYEVKPVLARLRCVCETEAREGECVGFGVWEMAGSIGELPRLGACLFSHFWAHGPALARLRCAHVGTDCVQ